MLQVSRNGWVGGLVSGGVRLIDGVVMGGWVDGRVVGWAGVGVVRHLPNWRWSFTL